MPAETAVLLRVLVGLSTAVPLRVQVTLSIAFSLSWWLAVMLDGSWWSCLKSVILNRFNPVLKIFA